MKVAPNLGFPVKPLLRIHGEIYTCIYMCIHIYIYAQVPMEKEKRIASIESIQRVGLWVSSAGFQFGLDPKLAVNMIPVCFGRRKDAVNLILILPSHALAREIAILHYMFSCRQDPEFFVYKTKTLMKCFIMSPLHPPHRCS